MSTGSDADTGRRPVHDGLFIEDEHGSPFLLGGRCDACDRVQFPMAPTCPACGVDTITEVRLSDHGTLWGWTAVTAPPPGALGDVPFGFGVVELPEGLRVITRLTESDPTRLSFGMPMQLVVIDLGPEPEPEPKSEPRPNAAPDSEGRAEIVTTYAFAPAVAT